MTTDGGGSRERANRTLLPVYLFLETSPALTLTRSQKILLPSDGGASVPAARGARAGWRRAGWQGARPARADAGCLYKSQLGSAWGERQKAAGEGEELQQKLTPSE